MASKNKPKNRTKSLRLSTTAHCEQYKQLGNMSGSCVLADSIPQIIWILQADGELQDCNLFWLNYSGLNFEQSLRTGWHANVHPDDLYGMRIQLQQAQENRQDVKLECRLLRVEDRAYRWHVLQGVPYVLPSGELSFWVVTFTDIEDKRTIENDLIRAKQESAAASQAKSAFLANMSHEIRTPLGIVLGYAELLATSNISELDRQKYLLSIKRNGELLSRLIGDALDLSRIEAGNLHVEKIHFSLPDFLRSTTQSFQYQANEKNIRLITELKTPIPISIFSDPMRLRQILFNVVSNAIKFTDQGEVKIRVEMLSTTPGKEQLLIAVSDQGLGITVEQSKKLFQPFLQADNSTTRKYGGIGLGLSLSRQLARRLEGDVVLAASQPLNGSTFAITIPTGALTETEVTNTLESDPPMLVAYKAAGKLKLEGVKILVVDDAPENQFLLKHFLGAAGAIVSAADNGQEAIAKALSGNFDLVLMDIQMPVLDGYQATQQLRKFAFNKPILALTAYALKEERDRCLAVGCNYHLTKPINREELLKQVYYYSRPDWVGTEANL